MFVFIIGGRDLLIYELMAVSSALGALDRGEESVIVYLLLCLFESCGGRGGWEGGIAINKHSNIIVGRLSGGKAGGKLVSASIDALFGKFGGRRSVSCQLIGLVAVVIQPPLA